jgi:MFS family permease
MKTAAFALQASIVVALLAASSAPTPVYPAWQAAWGFSTFTVTLVFGAYALAVLASLLVFGSLSDHIGRTPVVFAALLVQLISLALFARASGVAMLVVARTLQGLSTGAAVAALSAGLLDLDRQRGSLANAIAPMGGTALGALGSGLMVQFLPAPTTLVFYVLGGVLALQTCAVLFMRESVAAPRRGAWASLRPRVRLPRPARSAFALAAPALVAAWAVPGFYGSLGPSLMRIWVGGAGTWLGGLCLFVLAGSGALAVLLTLELPPHRVLALGSAALVAGAAGTLVGLSSGTLWVFLGSAVVTGGGFGLAFQGGLRSVVPLVEAHQRAGVMSLLLIVAYLSFGLPAVVAGLWALRVGVHSTAIEYSLAVMGVAAIALVRALPQPIPLERKSP